MTKAYSYVRFSTPEQAHGDSLRRQTELAAKYAREHDLELDTELTFQDLGLSAFRGKNTKIGELAAFLRGVQDGLIPEGSFLLVESLDRISRDQILDAQAAFLSIIAERITLVTLQDGKAYSRDTINANPTDLIMSIVTLMRAHEESATKSTRLKAVYETKRKTAREPNQTKPFTRRTPAWIEWNEADKKMKMIPERAAIVRDIFEFADAGLGKHAIAAKLNSRRVKTFGRAQFWQKSYVQKILQNPACGGTFVPKRKEETPDRTILKVAEEPIHDYFPAAVPQDLYERVTARGASAAPRGRHSGSAVTSVVAGVAKCGLCGSAFVRVSKGKYVYIVCSRAHAKAGCEYLAVPYQDVETALIKNMRSLIDDAPKGGDTSQLEGEIASLDEELSSLGDDGRFLTDEFRRSHSPTIAAQIAALDSEIRVKKTALEAKRQQRDAQSSKYVVQRLETMRAAFKAKGFKVEVANRALQACVKRLEFNPKTPRIGVEWPTGSWAAEGIPLQTRHLELGDFESVLSE